MVKQTRKQKFRLLLIYLSFFLFPITFYLFSPYLIIMGASMNVINGSFIVFALLFFSSLFFGRGFCGWLCPVSGFQDILQRGAGKTLQNGKKNLIKYGIWIPWLAIISMTAIGAGGYNEVNFWFQYIGTQDMLSFEIIGYFAIYYIVLTLVIFLHFTTGRRGFCHTSCWIAPFMVVGTKIRDTLKLPGFRLHAVSENCSSCTKCSKNCPMNLPVMEMALMGNMRNSECIMCLNCVDQCHKKAITYSFGLSSDKVPLAIVSPTK